MGETGGGIGLSRNPATNRDIQDDVERMVKNPAPLVSEARPIKGLVVHPVHEEGEVAGVPLQREGVKAISKSAVRQRVGVREKGVGVIKVPRPVYRSVNTRRIHDNILPYFNLDD